MMNKEKIEACKKLCREFLERAEALKQRAESQRLYYNALLISDGKPEKEYSFYYLTSGTRESGALRRTSMDLTRALADLRRPG